MRMHSPVHEHETCGPEEGLASLLPVGEAAGPRSPRTAIAITEPQRNAALRCALRTLPRTTSCSAERRPRSNGGAAHETIKLRRAVQYFAFSIARGFEQTAREHAPP